MNEAQIKPLIVDTYLAMINNAVGSRMFQSGYAEINGVKTDVLKAGELSCAMFVSSILSIFNLIDEPHTTVKSTVAKMGAAGWQKTEELEPGYVLVWEAIDSGSGDLHTHIGFYTGNDEAMSNDFKTKMITRHHYRYEGDDKGERKIIAIYCHPSFMKYD